MMDDIIYERDYRSKPEDEADKRHRMIFDQAVNGGFFDTFKAEMDKIPKIIVPEDKANYEYLLDRCDKFAERHRGYIRGIVDYHKWQSEIVMTLPFAEFCDPEDLAFLRELAEKSHSVTFEPDEENSICVRIFICYFDELMTDEHEYYLKYSAVMDDEKLASMLNIPKLSPEQEEITQRMNAILDRFDEETDIDRTTAFKAVLEHMMKQDEDHQTLEYMADRLERLLEQILNGEDAE